MVVAIKGGFESVVCVSLVLDWFECFNFFFRFIVNVYFFRCAWFGGCFFEECGM